METIYSEVRQITGTLFLTSKLSSVPTNAIVYVDNDKLFRLRYWASELPKCVLIDENTLFSHLVSYSISMQIPIICVSYNEISGFIGMEINIDCESGTIKVFDSSKPISIGKFEMSVSNINANEITLLPTIKQFSNAEFAHNLNMQHSGLICTEFFYDDIASQKTMDTFDKIADFFKDGISYFRLYDNDNDKQFIKLPVDSPNFLRGIRAYAIPEVKKIIDRQINYLSQKSNKQDIITVVPYVTSSKDMEFVSGLFGRRQSIKLSPLIETPSALFEADELSKYGGSIFIGTNDLMSSFFAYERNGLGRDAHYCNPYSISFWRMLISLSEDQCKKAIICGQLPLIPYMFSLLMSLGFSTFSVPSVMIPFLQRKKKSSVVINRNQAVDLIRSTSMATFKPQLAECFS